MSLKQRILRSGLLVAVIGLALTFLPSAGMAQFYDLEVYVGDTTGYPATNSVVSVFMNNFSDTVAGFQLWLRTDFADKIVFATVLDTVIDTTYWKCTQWNGSTCIDSVAASYYWVCTQYSGGNCIDSIYELGHYQCTNYHLPDSACLDSVFITGYDHRHIDSQIVFTGMVDTTGTLISGWEMVQTRSFSPDHQDLKITASANLAAPPYTRGIGFPPGPNRKPLIKIRANINNIPDSATQRTVQLGLGGFNLDNIVFVDQKGTAIGVQTYQIPDTMYFHCQSWYNGHCLVWERVLPGQPYDSMHIDTVTVSELDPNLLSFTPGSLTILRGICGDVNNNHAINILDPAYLINFLYKGGPAPPVPRLADCNGKAGLNVLDAAYLINFLYKSGPAPVCSN